MREHCVRVERTSDLAGAAVRHVEEAFGIAAVATGTLGHVVHDAAGRALDLISSARAVLAELRDHGAQGTNQMGADPELHVHAALLAASCGRVGVGVAAS
jgi:hypothetical protein